MGNLKFIWIGILYSIVPISCEVYLNQWGVHIKGGSKVADQVAQEHGFQNLGQIGSLKDHYSFTHHSISKRSVESARHHHSRLTAHSDVLWAEQQTVRIRSKRGASTDDTMKDPLWPKQWYLHGGAEGHYDMNVEAAWRRGYSGKGVVVTILDDGIEHSHPDLHDNYDSVASLDINDGDDDPMPRYDTTDENRHGTRCAGEVAALANNSVCAVGVAFRSQIGGVRMLDGEVSDLVEATALSHEPQHVDVYSASWGPDDNGRVVDGPATLAKKAFIDGVLEGRGGKGSIFVWASGNGGSYHDSCSCDGYTNSIFTLSVSSTSEHGNKPWYLEQCASTLTTTYSSGENYHERKIVTTDLHNKCTELHTGTSASAPLAAGLIALTLQANPTLTWRDMQYIVVHTSRPEPMVDGEWVINGVKRKVSHKYGYGLMDADAMVSLAERWTVVPDQNLCISELMVVNQAITGKGTYVKTVTDACAGTANHIRYLEHVQAKVTVHYQRRGDMQIHLISPNGTRSTLLPRRKQDYSSYGFQEWPFMSVFYWGESPDGTWKLEFENVGNINNKGELVSWQLILYGTEQQPVNVKSAPQKPILPAGSGDDQDTGIPKGELCNDQCDLIKGCTGPMPADCVKCKHVRLGDKGPCMQSCPEQTFMEDGICRHCLVSCSACLSLSHCESCLPGFYLHSDHLCTAACPEGYVADNSSGTCQQCAPLCAACVDSSTKCVQCQPGNTLQGTQCVKQCKQNEYRKNDGTCMSCDTTCQTCQGPHPHQCLSCRDDLIYLNSSCVEQCPPNFYKNTDTSIECRRCHPSCEECTGALDSQCVSCRLPLKLSGSRCYEDCSEGQYDGSDGHCQSCHATCLSCRGPTHTDCLSCHIATFEYDGACVSECPTGFVAVSQRCQPCHRSCSTCSGVNGPADCLSCIPPLLLSDRGCVEQCSAREYSQLGSCHQCTDLCLTCTSAELCTSCTTGSILHQHRCGKSCPNGWFPNNGHMCQPCHVACKTCSGDGDRACETCRDGLLMTTDGLCIEQFVCPRGYVFQIDKGLCVPCHQSCSHCSAAGAQACLQCKPGLQLYTERHQCVPCCSDSITAQCCMCDSTSGVCLQNHFIISGYSASSLPPPVHPDVSATTSLDELPPVPHLPWPPWSGVLTLIVLFAALALFLFLAVFGLLHARTHERLCWRVRYKPVPTFYHNGHDKTSCAFS